MLDFSQISKPRHVLVPIVNRRFVLDGKSYVAQQQIDTDCFEDGWYPVEIRDNKVRVLPQDFDGEVEVRPSDIVKGYTHNNMIVFQNFDVAKRKWGFGLTAPLHFNQSQTFEAINATVWEDKQIFWACPSYTDVQTIGLRDLLDEGKTIDGEKQITPELRTLFLFHALEREQMRQLQEAAKQKEDHERMMRDIPYRLKLTFERAGAELIGYSMSGKRIICDWKVKSGEYQYNTVLNSETWMVEEAGYCMTHDDKRHNITSLVKTAEEYEERSLVHLTRTSD